MIQWPVLLHALVREYGTRVVWVVGMRVFGYPPTWATNGKELFLLSQALQG